MTVKRKAITVKDGKYSKVGQIKSGGKWVPRHAIASSVLPGSDAFASRIRGFRHIHHRYMDRRLHIFRFRITRDDGTVIEETMFPYLHAGGIKIYRKRKDGSHENVAHVWGYHPDDEPEDAAYWTFKNDIWYYERNFYPENPDYDNHIWQWSYNTKTQIWTVPLFGDTPVKQGKNFYVIFHCDDSAKVRYAKPENDELRYVTTDDFGEDIDYIRPKLYEVAAPYFKVEYESVDKFPDEIPPPGTYCSYTSMFGECHAIKHVIEKAIVKSSIPYTVTYVAQNKASMAYKGEYDYSPHHPETIPCGDPPLLYDWFAAEYDYEIEEFVTLYRPDWVTGQTSRGDLSTNLHTNPIDQVKEIITPPKYTVEENLHTTSLTYTGQDPFILKQACLEEEGPPPVYGELEFSLAFKIFRCHADIWAERNV